MYLHVKVLVHQRRSIGLRGHDELQTAHRDRHLPVLQLRTTWDADTADLGTPGWIETLAKKSYDGHTMFAEGAVLQSAARSEGPQVLM